MQDMSGRDPLGVSIANSAILGCLFNHLVRREILAEADVAAIVRNALTQIGTGMTTPSITAREIVAEFNTRISKPFEQDIEKD